LRLTVSAEGRVTRAEVVTSSGREELDQAAQAWIVAHWAYRPALDNGAPVSSQVLTIMTFSLASER
jgi:TonB family protein